MNYLIDTNVISEVMKPRPDLAVLEWLNHIPNEQLWISSIVIAEVLSGLDLMPDGKRQTMLLLQARSMIHSFFGSRIFAFDQMAAMAVGPILKQRRNLGRPVDKMDAMIAATAAVHSATIVTRNVRDFEHCGVALFNPWPDPEENLI